MSKYDFEINIEDNSSDRMILKKIVPNSIVLEFGCATGRMTRHMKETMGCKVYIVEYDKGAYEQALQYAEGGICDDIMNFQWLETFKDVKFDAIIFADVLEHLNNPESVLEKAGKLLADRGYIYASIPNITHNDIILKAMEDRFDYTSTGLLDDTHIHFWGLENIKALSGKGELYVQSIEATSWPTGATEQYAGWERTHNPLLLNLLRERKGGEVYQYVISLSKEKCTYPEIKIQESSIASRLCIFYEDKSKKEDHIQIDAYYSGNDSYIIHYVIENPEEIRRVQLLPVGNQSCILKNYSIRQGEEDLLLPIGRTVEIQDGLFLLNNNSAVYADVRDKNLPITIDIEIILPGKRFIEAIIKDYQNPRTVSAATLKELETYRKNFPILMGRMELAEAKYEMIENATFWKISKPLRMFIESVRDFSSEIKEKRQAPDGIETIWKQKQTKFDQDIKFSILVPLKNTNPEYLREMIGSVKKQTYAKWELCLVDSGEQENSEIEKICRKQSKCDSRIRYEKLKECLSICEQTNACIDMASGAYCVFLQQDAQIHRTVLFEMMEVITRKQADFLYTDEKKIYSQQKEENFRPHYKPDYAPDTLRSTNYIGHFIVVHKPLLDHVGGMRIECEGNQDHDLILRLTEQAKNIVHIPKVLYYSRAYQESLTEDIESKTLVPDSVRLTLESHLERVGLAGTVAPTDTDAVYRIQYKIQGEPLVSIVIPNYEFKRELQTCLESIYEKTTYHNFEIIIIENNSRSAEIFQYYEEIQQRWSNLKVVVWDDYFNYSAINNFGMKYASGEHIILLNNDTEVLTPDWIQEMLMFSQRKDVGAVGVMLYYPDDTVQHAGVGLGLHTLAGHFHKYLPRDHQGYMGRMKYTQNLSAVTAACMMVRRDVWDEVGGLDETFEVAFNDVDLCMKIRKAGYSIIWTPFAELYHYESKSRGTDMVPEKKKRHDGEVKRFQQRWAKELADGDPYYNPNLPIFREDFGIQ